MNRLITVQNAIQQLLSEKETVIVAIDGNCTSGKTTLASQLAANYDCNVFHMDDFFLPFERKTPERLAEPGGNVDRERFYREVILRYKESEPITYGVYDCSCGQIARLRSAAQAPLLIVEGSYCLHPLMADAYDLKVFSTCPADVQSQRILQRDGETFHRHFIEEWIPMENRYFEVFKISDQSEIIL